VSTGGATGPLTPAEQVAVLDAELERGTSVFDDLILEEQAEQQRREREKAAVPTAPSVPATGNTSMPGQSSRSGVFEGGVAGGTSGGGPPTNTVKYPPPDDIPQGDDDDVVARQLREAAMREPDPEIRERLWDEYRKYRGLK
jgi:hypothetical protein